MGGRVGGREGGGQLETVRSSGRPFATNREAARLGFFKGEQIHTEPGGCHFHLREPKLQLPV